MRKVVQIAEWDGTPIVLCCDGSMWWYYATRREWTRLPDIPQEPSTLAQEGDGRPGGSDHTGDTGDAPTAPLPERGRVG